MTTKKPGVSGAARKPHVRMAPGDRKQILLDAAVKKAAVYGINGLTRKMIAEEADVTPGLVTRYFSNRGYLRKAVIAEAVRAKNVSAVAWAMAEEHKLPELTRSLQRDARAWAAENLTYA